MQHLLDHVLLDELGRGAVGVLRGHEQALDLDRLLPSVLVDLVADGHLRLAVGAEVADLAGLAHVGEPLCDLVREHDRQRHQLRRLVRRVAEHHALVTGADIVERIVVARVVLQLVGRVDAERDVRRLRVDRHDDAARVRIEAERGVRVADAANRFAHQIGDVDVGGRGYLAGHNHEPRRDQRLARATDGVSGSNRSASVQDRRRR